MKMKLPELTHSTGLPQRFLLWLGTLLVSAGMLYQLQAFAGSPPVITSVSAAQDPLPSKNVTVHYTIRDPSGASSASVFIRVSKDSGATWTVPASTFTGDVGTNVAVTNSDQAKSAVWNAGADWDGNYGSRYRVRVVANNDTNFSLVPPGTYIRGNYLADGDGLQGGHIGQVYNDSDITDAPTNSVFVSGFFIEKNLVTGGQWNLVVGYATDQGVGYDLSSAIQQNPGAGPSFKASNHPIQNVNWFDAVKWCNARSEMEGLTPVYYLDANCQTVYRNGSATAPAPYIKAGNTNGYRLPTEAEWEKAARGGLTGHRFPWITGGAFFGQEDFISWDRANYTAGGQYVGQLCLFGGLDQLGRPLGVPYDEQAIGGYSGASGNDGHWSGSACQCETPGASCFSYIQTVPGGGSTSGPQPFTSPVGVFPANGCSLYDMAGNVNQWCWDWYDSSYYAPGQMDPQGPSSGSNRVSRGGSWDLTAGAARCAYRNAVPPISAFFDRGFRCVRGL
jgi:formylglycine-generating enzyme required for sulfatase activity